MKIDRIKKLCPVGTYVIFKSKNGETTRGRVEDIGEDDVVLELDGGGITVIVAEDISQITLTTMEKDISDPVAIKQNTLPMKIQEILQNNATEQPVKAKHPKTEEQQIFHDFIREWEGKIKYIRLDLPEFDIQKYRNAVSSLEEKNFNEIFSKAKSQFEYAKKTNELNRLEIILQDLQSAFHKFPYATSILYNIGILQNKLNKKKNAIWTFYRLYKRFALTEAAFDGARIAAGAENDLACAYFLSEYFRANDRFPEDSTALYFSKVMIYCKQYGMFIDIAEVYVYEQKDISKLNILLKIISYVLHNNQHQDAANTIFKSVAETDIYIKYRILRNTIGLLAKEISKEWEEFAKERDDWDERFKQEDQDRAWESKHKEANEAPLAPNAQITNYRIDRNSGTLELENKQSSNIFKITDIVEPSLSNKVYKLHAGEVIPVICSFSRNGNVSKIFEPKTVEKMISLGYELLNDYKISEAIEAMKIILEQQPANREANQLIDECNNAAAANRKPNYSARKSNYSNRGIYFQAKQATESRNFTKAINLYKEAIKQKDRFDSCIKDLASLYQRMEKFAEAIKIIEENLFKMENPDPAYLLLANIYKQKGETSKAISILEKNIKSFQDQNRVYNVLADLYYFEKKYERSIEYLEKLLKISPIDKHVDIKKRQVLSYLSLNNFDQAKKLLQQILKRKPNESVAKTWLERVKEAEKTGDYLTLQQQIFNENDFSEIAFSGLSKILQNDLDKCEEFILPEVLPARVVANRDFTQESLLAVRRSQEETRGKPKQRASCYLAEAWLMRELGTDDSIRLNSVLIRYANAMADIAALENRHTDVVRSYYLEAFSLQREWEGMKRQVSVYILSFIYSGQDLTSQGKDVSIQSAMENIVEKNMDIQSHFWHGLLEMFVVNRTISAHVLSTVFKNQKAHNSAWQYLDKISISNSDNNRSEQTFLSAWDKAREKRQNERKELHDSVKVKVSLDSLSIENVVSQMYNKLKDCRREWLTQLDQTRISEFSKSLDMMNDYLKQMAFEEKEHYYNMSRNSLSRLQEEIEQAPTRFSMEVFSDLIVRIIDSLDNVFENLEQVSLPKISISLEGDYRSYNQENNITTIHVKIANEKHCSPINNLELYVKESVDCQLKEHIYSPERLKGGEERTLILELIISDKVIEEKVTTLDICCKYDTRKENGILMEQTLSLKLYSQGDFICIDPNPYASFAEGGAVKDKKMFYGRNELIKKIAESLITNSKCVVFYGQKRSGKSSVLFHLQDYLHRNTDVICGCFSLGGSIENFSTEKFLYQIISSIKNCLDNLQNEKILIPQMEFPTLGEILEGGYLLFCEVLKNFKKICQATPGWEQKKLIILMDEFTYLYSEIKKGSISKLFMKTWKNIIEEGLFSAVVVGQDVMPKFQEEYRNEFGIAETIRIPYLTEEEARKLIEDPILDRNRNDASRYLGNSTKKIIDLTKGSPFYIQIFCSNLVVYMNHKNLVSITEADIDAVAEDLTSGAHKLRPFGGTEIVEKHFDGLLTAGDADLEAVPVKEVKKILRKIAEVSEKRGYCAHEDIKVMEERLENKIIEDLIRRQVISCPRINYYEIEVKLFQKWLLKH